MWQSQSMLVKAFPLIHKGPFDADTVMATKKSLESVDIYSMCAAVRARKTQTYYTCTAILVCMFQCCYLSDVSGKFCRDINKRGLLTENNFVGRGSFPTCSVWV